MSKTPASCGRPSSVLSPVVHRVRPLGSQPSSVLKCGLINHRDGWQTYVPRAEAREQPYARGELELPLSKVELDLDWSAGRAAPGSGSDFFFDCCSS